MAEYREFETGATRTPADEKLDYEAFFSPLVLKRRAKYMHKNRKRLDGTLRDGDNWQLGIPMGDYAKSLARHVEDFKLHHRGFPDEAVEDLETSLCAIMFNCEGFLHELLKTKRVAK